VATPAGSGRSFGLMFDGSSLTARTRPGQRSRRMARPDCSEPAAAPRGKS
jgi:hypothetical protein